MSTICILPPASTAFHFTLPLSRNDEYHPIFGIGIYECRSHHNIHLHHLQIQPHQHPFPPNLLIISCFSPQIFFLTWKKVSTLILMYRCIQHSAIHPYTIHNYTCWRKHRHKQPTNTTTKTTKNKRKTPEWMENLKEQKNETSEKLCKWHSGKCSKGCGRRWECKYGMYKKRRKIVYKITGAFKNIQMKLSRSH